MATTTTSPSTTAVPTLPLEMVRIINDVASIHALMSAASAAEPTSFTFDPMTDPTKSTTIPFHDLGNPTRGFAPSDHITPMPTSTMHPPATLQSEVPPHNTGPWYQEGWVGPFTWALIIYCFGSIGLFAIFWLSGCLNWRLDVRYPTYPFRAQARSHRSRRSRNSIETELGDPDEEDQFEVLRRRWASRGIRVTVEQLRAQQQAYDELQARRAERERSVALMVANMRAHGILP